MIHVWKRALAAAALLALALGAFGFPGPALAEGEGDPAKEPAEISLTMTCDPGTSVTICWTTLDTKLKNPVALIWESGSIEASARQFEATAVKRNVNKSTVKNGRKPVTVKNFYTAPITGLTPGSEYCYRCGVPGYMSAVGTFKTAPAGNDEYTFLYAADPQVARYHSNAWLANLGIMRAICPDAGFMLVAGDFTDNNNEGEWESFFNQPGNQRYIAGYGSAPLSGLPIAGVAGDHDGYKYASSGIYTHFSFESQVNGVPVTYAFDYGAARFIVLDLEDPYSLGSPKKRAAQAEFLNKEVAQAKAEGKWTIVAFHEALYSGAKHMAAQVGVISSRKHWGPVLAALDVDVVLAGHDHVFSRGFVQANGSKADITDQFSDREYMAFSPANAPLYYTGGCASTRKFYGAYMDDKWIARGDPITKNFGYLDICSGLPAGYISKTTGKSMNPGPFTYLTGDARYMSFTSVTVADGWLEFKTYMTGFNPIKNIVTQDTFLYDSLLLIRNGSDGSAEDAP
jgi:hypothetical protein